MSAKEIRSSRSVAHQPYARTDYEERRWYLTEMTDEDEAVTVLRANADDCINIQGKNLWAREYYADPIDGAGKYLGRVVYRQKQWAASRSFDISTANVRIYKSLGTTWKYPANACDFEGAIEVSGDDNEVKGIEVFEAAIRYQEIHRLPTTDYNPPGGGDPVEWLTPDSIRLYSDLIGSTNSDIWRGWLPEEVLFLGMTAQNIPNDIYMYQVTYEFAIAAEGDVELPFTDQDNNLTTNKKGWHYLWYKYDPKVVTECGAVLQTPNAAYIEQIYPTSAFANQFPPENCEWTSQDLPFPACDDELFPECTNPPASLGVGFDPPNPRIPRHVSERAAILEQINKR